MSRAFDRAADFLDRVVELLDNPTQESAEDGSEPVAENYECWRCLRESDDLGSSELCHECRLWLTEVRDDDPKTAEDQTTFRESARNDSVAGAELSSAWPDEVPPNTF